MGAKRQHAAFTFKRFAVEQDRCAMKVGTDGVLLGAWAQVPENAHILDIGTGTGLVALMLAQRYPAANVLAVEIEPEAATQAAENVENSPFSERIKVLCADARTLSDNEKFDCIVCNPPYFDETLKSPDSARATARHNDTLTLQDLLQTSAKLLKTNGSLQLILPTATAKRLIDLAKTDAFALERATHIFPTPQSSEKRTLLHFFRGNRSDFTENSLVIELERHIYSDAYKRLTHDFYLKFLRGLL